ncbi:Ca(2+)-dependent cysteine protease [Tulasnella sp. UAMH 9824]|nr:Ca(2+)-dependent cysteine protease [Tulasnella sp. UAMH 9824]
MTLASGDPLVPTHTHNQRGATTSPSVAALPPPVGASTSKRATEHRQSGSWGATPEKMTFLEQHCITHTRTADFETIFKAAVPMPEGGLLREKRRLALVVAISYNGAEAMGWTPLLGPAVDLTYWVRFLRARNYECDFLWDGLSDVSSRPTKDVILHYLRWLAECASPGDEVVLVFSGHGNKSAYIPLNCPVDHSDEAIYPEDIRESFLKSLEPESRVAVLVVWDTCNASNPFGLPQMLALEDNRVISKPIEVPQASPEVPEAISEVPEAISEVPGAISEVPEVDFEHPVVVICASSGKNLEVELNKEPETVNCGPLCWAAFTFVLYHRRDLVQPGGILKALMEHIYLCVEDKEEFLASTGPDVAPEVLKLLDTLLAAHHKRPVKH